MTTVLRVVLVGYGPVGARFVEEVLPAVRSGSVELTVVGAEDGDAYNRVLLADYAALHTELAAMSITDTPAAVQAGVHFHTGTRVIAIDRTARTVTLSSGAIVPFDRLVLATGARANIPTLTGIERTHRDRESLLRHGANEMATDTALPAGVVVLRDLADAERVRSVVRNRQRIVVLGAGVLGLEVALATALEGADVHVVHHGGYPMARNLDKGAGAVLTRSLRSAGVKVAAHSRAESIDFRTDDDGVPRFDALLCADGKRIEGDLLVLSCGIGARIELATLAELPTSTGILVDRRLRSWGDSNVYAIGDCAHVAEKDANNSAGRPPGGPSGLIGPGWRQATWLAAQLIADVSSAAPPPPLTDERPGIVMLKADDVDVVAAGDTDVEPWDSDPIGDHDGPARAVSLWADPEHGRYVKMVTRGGILEAMVCVGMPRTAAELTLLFERGSELPADRSVLLRHDGPDYAHTPTSTGFDADATVCWCNGVTAGRIRESADAGSCTVADVSADTRAGTGCGGCKGRITELLAQFNASATPVVS